jgi:hypothetical protein
MQWTAAQRGSVVAIRQAGTAQFAIQPGAHALAPLAWESISESVCRKPSSQARHHCAASQHAARTAGFWSPLTSPGASHRSTPSCDHLQLGGLRSCLGLSCAPPPTAPATLPGGCTTSRPNAAAATRPSSLRWEALAVTSVSPGTTISQIEELIRRTARQAPEQRRAGQARARTCPCTPESPTPLSNASTSSAPSQDSAAFFSAFALRRCLVCAAWRGLVLFIEEENK